MPKSKSSTRKKAASKMPPIQKSAVRPTHFTRAQIRRAVKAVAARHAKLDADIGVASVPKPLSQDRSEIDNSSVNKSKKSSSAKPATKMVAVQRTLQKPTHFTRAEIRRAVRAVIAERGKGPR